MEPVKELNSNDVLFGRGMRASMYIGTQKFRDICEAKNEDYRAARKNEKKRAIAQQVVDEVIKNGGRFLKQKEGNTDEDDDWYEVIRREDILAKTTQALRQADGHKRDRPNDHGGTDTNTTVPLGSHNGSHGGFLSTVSTPMASSFSSTANQFLPPYAAAANTFLPSTTTAGDPRLPPSALSFTNANMDPHSLLLFHQTASVNAYSHALLFQQQRVLMQLASARSLELLEQQQQQQTLTAAQQQMSQPNPRFESLSPENMHVSSSKDVASKNTTPISPIMEEIDDKPPPELKTAPGESCNVNDEEDKSEDAEEFLMSVLQLSGLPRFTNHAEERANTSEEEKEAALSDMFGKYCNVHLQKNKRARRDLDPESIAFLIKCMRDKIECISKSKKEALLEAQEKCGEQEFCDKRLECFLRCEGMDAPLAANRFVRYWDKRREVFGPDKYIMKMTLSEALCDDLAALLTGSVFLLPKVDASGRQLIFYVPGRHNREGYTSESMLRAYWYITEVASRANKHIDCAFVKLGTGKDFTLWELDPWLYRRMNEFETSCLPIRLVCKHAFPVQQIAVFNRIVIPIVSATQSKQVRLRCIWHAVPDKEIPSVMPEYGITADMLPTELGGSIQLNPKEWIAEQRAMEMEEL